MKIMRLLLFVLCTTFGLSQRIAAQPDLPGNRPERLTWLQDAGFGMFIHWSHDSQIGSVISHSMVGASEDYLNWFIEDLPQTFNPTRWDAEEVAVLARLCGMKYVVLTAKHHSGFCLWDSETTDFGIMNTPHGRDILADYVQALRKHGLAVGLYYSPEDFAWLHRNGYTVRRRAMDVDPNTDPAYTRFIRDQVTELFSHYGPIDMLFIDGAGEIPTKEVAWRLQPDCLITRGAITTPEQFVPGLAPEGAWEANLTMGTQWQYKPTNDDYKSGTRILEILIETRAKGGALLMNVGPKPNGELPIEQEARLREVALWQAVNAEAIHDTRPWIVTNEEDTWFTRRGDTVYAILTRQPDWPRGDRRAFVLQTVRATPDTRVSVLGHAGKVVEYDPENDPQPRFDQTEAGLMVSVVRAQRLYNNHKWHNPLVVKLENVEPALARPPAVETGEARADSSGRLVLGGRLHDLGDADRVTVSMEVQVYGGFAEAMYNTDWEEVGGVELHEPGPYTVDVEGLEPGVTYQYRAVVHHPRVTLRGDHLRVEVASPAR